MKVVNTSVSSLENPLTKIPSQSNKTRERNKRDLNRKEGSQTIPICK
jgi:hypothetical protein